MKREAQTFCAGVRASIHLSLFTQQTKCLQFLTVAEPLPCGIIRVKRKITPYSRRSRQGSLDLFFLRSLLAIAAVALDNDDQRALQQVSRSLQLRLCLSIRVCALRSASNGTSQLRTGNATSARGKDESCTAYAATHAPRTSAARDALGGSGQA